MHNLHLKKHTADVDISKWNSLSFINGFCGVLKYLGYHLSPICLEKCLLQSNQYFFLVWSSYYSCLYILFSLNVFLFAVPEFLSSEWMATKGLLFFSRETHLKFKKEISQIHFLKPDDSIVYTLFIWIQYICIYNSIYIFIHIKYITEGEIIEKNLCNLSQYNVYYLGLIIFSCNQKKKMFLSVNVCYILSSGYINLLEL